MHKMAIKAKTKPVSNVAASIELLQSKLQSSEPRPMRGRIIKSIGTIIQAIVPGVRTGELCVIEDPRFNLSIQAEVVGFNEEIALLAPIGDIQGLSNKAEVRATGRLMDIPVGYELLGRVLDACGAPIDGKGPLNCTQRRPLMTLSPDPMTRRVISDPISLGVRAIDGFLTCGNGQRLGLFGAPGVGKSSLLAQIIKQADVDVAIIALVGERGREVREFVEHTLGEEGMRRSVLVVATSDRPAMERLKSAYSATAIAEYFRDEGKRVLLIMDSVTRFARAQREIGLAAGEPPTRRGFPPSVFAILASLMERAGPGEVGTITGLFSVLMEGDGTGDPVAEESRSILDGHIILDPKLADANHYPAIDVLASKSRLMGVLATKEHKQLAGRIRDLMARYKDAEFLIQVGEYKKGNDLKTDEAVDKIDRIKEFLKQTSEETSDIAGAIEWMKQLLE
jgi:ATP synthase in type III secretion protein N